MGTTLNIIANDTDSAVDYQTTPANYVVMNLVNDYLIWTAGSAAVADGQDEPTESELNAAATLIDDSNPVTVAKCFVYDADDAGGKIQLIHGMGDNKKYVFGFSFNGATATEPQLEAWDDTDHDSSDKHVLGAGTPNNSFVKGVCTTTSLPGASWAGAALAGANVLQLNDGNGAIGAVPSGQSTQELYANLKIVIPTDYATPAVEAFVLTCRYTWN